MRHRGRKLAAVEAHGSARRVDASKNGIPFGHDECLSRKKQYGKGWCNEIQTPTIGRTLRSDALGKKKKGRKNNLVRSEMN